MSEAENRNKVLDLNKLQSKEYFEYLDYTIKFIKNGNFENIRNLKINFNEEVLQHLQIGETPNLSSSNYSYIFQCVTQDNIYYSFISFEYKDKVFTFFEEDSPENNFFSNKLYGDDINHTLVLSKIYQNLNNYCDDKDSIKFYNFIDKISLKYALDTTLQTKSKLSINKI